MEGDIASLADEERKFLMLTNGFLGDRLVSIAQAYCSRVSVLGGAWGRALDADAVEQVLKREKDIRVVVMVHGETSTGILNPLREIGLICDQYGAILVADAVSTLAGAELAFDEWRIGIGVSAMQKCLEYPPGLVPIMVSPQTWTLVERSKGSGLVIWTCAHGSDSVANGATGIPIRSRYPQVW